MRFLSDKHRSPGWDAEVGRHLPEQQPGGCPSRFGCAELVR